MKLQVLYEDNALLVVYKPAGLAAQTKNHRQKDLETEVKNYIFEKNHFQGSPYAAMIHRLDQPVEGLMLFAKTKSAATALSQSLNSPKSQKYYLTVTNAPLPSTQGTLLHYLKKNPSTNTSMVVDAAEKDAKKSILHYKLLQTNQNACLYEILLETGRHHQIRAQLAACGAPILGDVKYGSSTELQPKGQIALCACKLSFCHPSTGKNLTFQIAPKNPAFEIFHISS